MALATAGGSAHLRSGLGRLVSHCVLGRRPRRACSGGRRSSRHGCRMLDGRLRLLRASPLPALEAEPVRRLLPQLLRVLRARCLLARLPCPLFTAASDSPPARAVRPVVLRGIEGRRRNHAMWCVRWGAGRTVIEPRMNSSFCLSARAESTNQPAGKALSFHACERAHTHALGAARCGCSLYVLAQNMRHLVGSRRRVGPNSSRC